VRAFLFVCSGDKTCSCTEGARATMVPAARQLALLSCCPHSGPWPCLSWLSCGAPFEGGRPEPMLCCLASGGSTSLYFVQLRLGAVTEGILYSWSAAPSRAAQTFALRQA